MLQLKYVLFAISLVICHQKITAEQPTNVELSIQEISRVMRYDDPSGRNHNTKVIIAPHPPLSNVNTWKLLLRRNSENIKTLNLMVDGWQPTTQTDFIFEGNLIDSDSIFLQALRNTEVVATAFLSIAINDLHSNLAWVGNNKTTSSSSLRVQASKEVGQVSVDGQNCTALESPCYYISPETRPAIIKRCVSFNYGSNRIVQLCDERETNFLEISQTPILYLQEGDRLKVTYIYKQNISRVEIVAFDPEDHNKIYSNSSYQCQVPEGQIFKEGESVSCLYNLTLPESQKKFIVLVVRTDEDGYVYDSSRQLFEGNPSKSYRTGVIVGSVVGSLIGVGIIVTLIFLFVLRRRTKKKKKMDAKKGLPAAYSRAPTTETEP